MKKDNIKSLVIIMSLNIILNIIFISITTYMEYHYYVQNVNNVILSIIGKDEIEAVKILNSDKPIYQEVDLTKYGITKESSVINSMTKTYHQSLIINIVVSILINLFITYLLYKMLSRYRKKIINVTKYVEDINNHNYTLLINENDEGELSKLRNELYKITVTLKEGNINVSKQKESLKEALSDISHQIKTPLTSINILLDSLDNPDMDPKTRNEFLSEIQSQVSKIEFLTLTLLKLARFDTNTIKFKREKINIYQLLKDVLDNVSILLEVKNITLNINCSKKITFKGDYKWELEALTNIVKNAIEYSYDNSKIDINVLDNALYTKINIQDYGCGIPQNEISHIFERFYKGKNSSQDSIGIGLALAKTIISKDNGTISVTSDKKGTTFTIKYFNI